EQHEILRRRKPRPQRLAEASVLDRVPERGDAFLPRVAAHGAEPAPLGEGYRADRLRVAHERAPQPERSEDALRAVRERRDARIEARLLEPRRVARLDEHGAAADRVERNRERRADEPAADDQHVAVEPSLHALHAVRHAALSTAVPTSRSISSASTGSSAVSTSQPSRVTTTSSSMRMPMPRQAFALPVASAAT